MKHQEKYPDIYFEPGYAELYTSEDSEVVEYRYEDENGIITNLFLKRQVHIPGEDKVRYYDIITPYGYGGPLMQEIRTSKVALAAAFEKDFSKYCRENSIVSEFIRFHPIMNNGEDFKTIYGSEVIRHTVGTDLTCGDPVDSEFGRQCRKNIRKAIRSGVSFRVTRSPESLSSFKEIYYSTMGRNEASEFYYFDDKYFTECQQNFSNHLILTEALFENRVIAAGMYFVYGDIIHIHLSGTLTEYLYLSPAYVLRYAITLWGKENGYRLIHHGGGRSNDENDSLYKFKKQFGRNMQFDFSIGKKIWNSKGYRELCEKLGTDAESGFFPAYRRAAI